MKLVVIGGGAGPKPPGLQNLNVRIRIRFLINRDKTNFWKILAELNAKFYKKFNSI